MILVACEKPNPEPERLDPIYSEIEKEVQSVEAALKAAQTELIGFQKDYAEVVPQSGQIKYAQKRVNETEAKIDKLEQLQSYWKLKLISRKQWARTYYMKAYLKKEPWPPPAEYQSYMAQRALEKAPKNWDAKQRVKEFGSPAAAVKTEQPPEGHGH